MNNTDPTKKYGVNPGAPYYSKPIQVKVLSLKEEG